MTSKPGDLGKDSGGGATRDARKDDNFAAQPFDEPTFILVDGVDGVVAALGVDVGLHDLQKLFRRAFLKQMNTGNALQGGHHRGTVGFAIHRTVRPLERANMHITGQSDQQRIAQVAGGFEVGDVTGMQDVEATVGDDEFAASSTQSSAPRGERFKAEDFFPEVHRRMVAGLVSGV